MATVRADTDSGHFRGFSTYVGHLRDLTLLSFETFYVYGGHLNAPNLRSLIRAGNLLLQDV